MSSKVRRRVTVEGSKSSDNGQNKRQSVFDRLGPGSSSISNNDRYGGDRLERCRNWIRTGSCPYGNNCRFQHGPFVISSKRTQDNRSDDRRTDDLRTKVRSSGDKSEKKSRSAGDSPKKSGHRSSSSRSKKKEHENKIKSTVVVTQRKPGSRSAKNRNSDWENKSTTDEEWSRNDLDYKEVLSLELERQQIQRELELEMQKDQEEKRENVIIQKMVMLSKQPSVSSSDSESSQSSSSCSSSSSSSSSTPPPRPKKKERKGPQTPPVAAVLGKQKSFFKEKARSQEEILSSKNKGPRTPSPFETALREAKRDVRGRESKDKDVEEDRDSIQKDKHRKRRKSSEHEHDASPPSRSTQSTGVYDAKKSVKGRKSNTSPKSHSSPSRPDFSDSKIHLSPDISRKNKRSSSKDGKLRLSSPASKIRYRDRSSSGNRSSKGRSSRTPDSGKYRKRSSSPRHSERIKSVAATVSQDRAPIYKPTNVIENRARGKFQKEHGPSTKRTSPEKDKRRQSSPESSKHEGALRSSSPRDQEKLNRDKGRLRDNPLYNERSRLASPEAMSRRLDNRHTRNESPDSRPTSRESRSTRTATTHHSRSPEPRSRPSTPDFAANRRGSPYRGSSRNYSDSTSRISPNNRGRRSPDGARRQMSPDMRSRTGGLSEARNRRLPSDSQMRRVSSVVRGRHSPHMNHRRPSPEFNRHYPPSPEMRRLPSSHNDFVHFDPMFDKHLPYDDRMMFDPHLMPREFSPGNGGSPHRQIDRSFDRYGPMRSPPHSDRFGRFEPRSPPRPDLDYDFDSPRRRMNSSFQPPVRGLRGRGRNLARGRSGFLSNNNRDSRFDRLGHHDPGLGPMREWEDHQFDERDLAIERRRELEHMRSGRFEAFDIKRPHEDDSSSHPAVKRRREDSPHGSSYSGRESLGERPDRSGRGDRVDRGRKIGYNKSDFSETSYRDHEQRDDKFHPDDKYREEGQDGDPRDEKIPRKRGRFESPDVAKDLDLDGHYWKKRAKLSDPEDGLQENEPAKTADPSTPDHEYTEERNKIARDKETREKERVKDKERDKEKDRQRSKEKEKEREKDKDREWDKEKDKIKDTDRDKEKDKIRIRENVDIDAPHPVGGDGDARGEEPFSDWSDEEDDILNRDEENNIALATEREEIDKHSIKSDESWPRHRDVPELHERGASRSSDGSLSHSSSFPNSKISRAKGKEQLISSEGRFGYDRSRSTSRHASEERQSRGNQNRLLSEKFPDRASHGDGNENIVVEISRHHLFDSEQKSLDSFQSCLGLKSSQHGAFTYETISDDEFDPTLDEGLDEEHQNTKEDRIVDALEVNWTSLIKDYRPKFEVTPGSALKRFTTANILSRIGVSKAFAGTELMEKIQKVCLEQMEMESKEDLGNEATVAKVEAGLGEIKSGENCDLNSDSKVDKKPDIKSEKSSDSSDSLPPAKPLEFKHDIAAFHASAVKRKQERAALISNIGQYRRALCARRDLWIRKQLCRITDGSSEALSSIYSQSIDNDLYKLSLQLFRQHKSGSEQKHKPEVVCIS